MSRLQRCEATIRFVVPAFIGGADQSAELRVPPFKSLLRYFWRIAVARRFGYDWSAMRDAEGCLFGKAGDKNSTRRSRLEVSLDEWKPGTLSQWRARPGAVEHPEVHRKGGIASDLYLGYGPLRPQGGRPGRNQPLSKLSRQPAIQERTACVLRLRVLGLDGRELDEVKKAIGLDGRELDEVKKAIRLAHWFGTVGSRSRNGWGSFTVRIDGEELPNLDAAREEILAIARPFDEAIGKGTEFAHAIGCDDRGLLVWRTRPMGSWEEVVRRLAQLKIGFRTQFSFRGRNHPRPEDRHILAYPVTNHRVNARGWGNNGRLANQLRFKITAEGRQYRGIVVHFPARLPYEVRRGFDGGELCAQEIRVWRQVHRYLDQQRDLARLV